MLPAYREYQPPGELEPLVACLWEHEAAEHRVQRVVPDGCIDLIWLAERGLVFAGPDRRPRLVGLAAGAHLSGLRLRCGAAGAVLGLPASELLDQNVPARLVWGEDAVRIEAALAGADPAQRLELLAQVVVQRATEPDALVRAAVHYLAGPDARVSPVAAQLGISERQLHRRMRAAVGYGPKMLARVARLRRLIALPSTSLAWRALEAGYASQSHMSDEVRRLTGTTPVRFLEDAGLTAA